MTKKINLEIDWLTRHTGDPFADTGGLVIKYLWSLPHLKDKNILELVKYVAEIYVNKWNSKLHAFFLNSKITQAAFKGQRKIDEAIKYYAALIDETEIFQEGYCRLSGRKTRLFSAGRDNHILSGSGAFVNFHHNFEPGLFLSKEMIIRMFFVPLGLVQLSDKVAMLGSNHEKVIEFFVVKNCQKNLLAINDGSADGLLKSEFNSPANALFDFANNYLSIYDDILRREGDETDVFDISISLYHFTNFGASPEVTIYSLESKVFKFYAFCNWIKVKDIWNKFLRYNYRNSKYKGALFDEMKETWKSKNEFIEYDVYKIWRNNVLEKLINDSSILPNIIKWSIGHPFPFSVVEKYQTIIRNMEKKTIEKIRQIADFIVVDRSSDFISKCIGRLNRGKYAYDLRRILIKLNGESHQKGGESPLITVQDYTEYLFPDGGNWGEIRDVLLIAIYEKLHEAHIDIDDELLKDENELETLN